MRSTFYGFEIAKMSLAISQKAIDITGHNIANADTKGYTRQRITLASKDPYMQSRFLDPERGIVGGGVSIQSLDQIRDIYIDKQYRKENNLMEMWNTRSEALSYIEQIFDETQDSGLSDSINTFFKSLHDLTNNPADKGTRISVIQNALKMTELFNHYSSQLKDKQTELDNATKISVMRINDISSNLVNLNEQIKSYELKGEKANDLRDKRNLLLDELSGIIDFTYEESKDGTVNVAINGKNLIEGSVRNILESNNNITWLDDGSNLIIKRGSLKAYLDMRDGDSENNVGIPYIINNLDLLAESIGNEINKVHSLGWTLPDFANGVPSITGVDFFNPQITAETFALSDAILENSNNIAASSENITSAELKGNNLVASMLTGIQNRTDIPKISSIDSFLKGIVTELAIETSHARFMFEGQETLTLSLSNQKSSVSGVSIDEEMTSLLRFQHIYAASARLITAIDEYLDVLINRTGIVGR